MKFTKSYNSSLLCGGAIASFGLLTCMMFTHPVVNDCAPVINSDAVNTWGNVVDDSVDRCVPLISSWPVINKATCRSLSLYHSLSEGNVLVHVVKTILVGITVAENFIHLVF